MLGPDRFEDASGLQLIGVGLVRWRRRCRQGDRVKNYGFGVGGLFRGELTHGAFVRHDPSALIDVLVVPVEFSYGRDVQPLTLRCPPTQARGGGNGLASLLQLRGSARATAPESRRRRFSTSRPTCGLSCSGSSA